MRQVFAVIALISLSSVLSHADVYALSVASSAARAFDKTNVHGPLAGKIALPLVVPVPEPDSVLLLVTMLAGLAGGVRVLRLSKVTGVR